MIGKEITYMKYDLTEDELEKLRQLVIADAMQKFGWTVERCEEVFGKDTSTFLSRINLIDNEEEE